MRFEYDVEAFAVVGFSVHRQGGMTQGVLLEIAPVQRELQAFMASQRGGGAKDDSNVFDALERAFRAAWARVRANWPDVRGFICPHDTQYVVDLDSGEQMPESSTGIDFWGN